MCTDSWRFKKSKVPKQLVQEAQNKLGGLDIVVLNAGIQQYEYDIQNLSEDNLRDTFEVNVFLV